MSYRDGFNTNDVGRIGTYMGGVGVSAYSYTATLLADEPSTSVMNAAPAGVTLLSVPVHTVGITVGDICALMGAIAVLGRMVLDWKRYLDKKRRDRDEDE